MSEILFLIFIMATVLITLSFIWGKKRNLEIMKKVSKSLEKGLDPIDKNYTLIGGVAGFKAQYKVKEFEKVEVTLILLPRQSLLYLPFSLIIRKRDFLFVVFKLKRRPPYEVHIVRKGDKVLDNLKLNMKEEKGSFIFFGKNIEALNFLRKWFPQIYETLHHFAILPEEGHIYLKIVLDGVDILSRVKDMVREEGW